MLLRSSLGRLPRLPPISRRHTRLLIVLGVVLVLFVWWPSPPLPTSFRSEWARERRLPQHDKGLPLPEGRHGRYVRLQHHVAFASNRSLAFEPWVKDETAWPFSLGQWPWRAARVPLTALAGIGGGAEILYDRPRAVSSKFYKSVCWSEKNVTLTSEQMASGQDRIAQLLLALEGGDGCVRVHGDVFSNEWFESPAPVKAAEALVASPISKHFTFAPAVLEILNRAMPVIAPGMETYDLDRAAVVTDTKPVPQKPWIHVLALDVHFGDEWNQACRNMSDRFAPFTGFAKLPKLPGNENVPPPQSMAEPSRHGLYAAKCSPDITTIIARTRRMKKNHLLLSTIYISTDAAPPWREELRRWLISEGWEQVLVGSTDVWSGWADSELGEAVDLEVARRSGVFVGNGFSSMGSAVALLRSGVHPDFTQYW